MLKPNAQNSIAVPRLMPASVATSIRGIDIWTTDRANSSVSSWERDQTSRPLRANRMRRYIIPPMLISMVRIQTGTDQRRRGRRSTKSTLIRVAGIITASSTSRVTKATSGGPSPIG